MQSRASSAGIGVGWDRLIPSWPLVIGLGAFVRALAEPMALLNDPDTYLHIAAGRWMLAHRALISADPFSHSMAGAAWQAPEWLAEIALAALYDVAGWGGVIVASAACFALALGLLTRFLLRRMAALPALVAALAGAALVLPHLLARPHVFALPLLVLWSGALLAARDEGIRPPLWLILLMALWANLHASFLFGLALAGFLAAEAVIWPAAGQSRATEAGRWGLFAAAAIGAALLTPHGPAGLVEPFRLMAMRALQAGFVEWLPPDFRQFPALEFWLLGALAIAFASGVRLPAARVVLLLALAHMALSHMRHADLLGLVGPLAVAGALGAALAARMPSSDSPLLRGAARLAAPAALPAIALIVGVAAALSLPALADPRLRGADKVTPAGAIAAAERLGLMGPVFNAEPFGGYLAFAGLPDFIDGRIEMYGNAFLDRYVEADRGSEAALGALLDQYHIAWTLLPPGSGAVATLDRLAGWYRAYADAQAVIHVRTDQSQAKLP